MTNATLSSKMAARCAQIDQPVVAINRYLPHQDITSITCDNRGSAAAMADHLSPLGCRRIAFVAGIQDASSSRDREAGFLRRLGQVGPRRGGARDRPLHPRRRGRGGAPDARRCRSRRTASSAPTT